MNENKLPEISAKGTGYNIMGLMADRKMKVETLAEKLQVSNRSSIYRWMNGSRFPTVRNLLQMSVLFGVPMESIIAVKGDDWHE